MQMLMKILGRAGNERGREEREEQWPQSCCHNQYHHCQYLLPDNHHITAAEKKYFLLKQHQNLCFPDQNNYHFLMLWYNLYTKYILSDNNFLPMDNATMKSTKVQTLGAYCMSCSGPAYYANARARKFATPRVVAVTDSWCCQFSLQHGLAASVGIVLGKAECC